VFGLGGPEIIILLLFLVLPAMIVFRVLRRKRTDEKPSEDDAGW